ncbi:hypothetical protein AMTRI_Chr13g84660 [Amborella trichopoda]
MQANLLPTTCYHSLSFSKQDEHVSPSHHLSLNQSLTLSLIQAQCASPSLSTTKRYFSTIFGLQVASPSLIQAQCTLSLSLCHSEVRITCASPSLSILTCFLLHLLGIFLQFFGLRIGFSFDIKYWYVSFRVRVFACFSVFYVILVASCWAVMQVLSLSLSLTSLSYISLSLIKQQLISYYHISYWVPLFFALFNTPMQVLVVFGLFSLLLLGFQIKSAKRD